MASIEITAEDMFNSLTKPCPQVGDEYYYMRAKSPKPTCFPWQRCGKCEDGRVLSHEGKRLALLFRTWDGSMHGDLPID